MRKLQQRICEAAMVAIIAGWLVFGLVACTEHGVKVPSGKLEGQAPYWCECFEDCDSAMPTELRVEWIADSLHPDTAGIVVTETGAWIVLTPFTMSPAQ